MAVLPYSRVVNATLSRNSAFPDRRGFGVALFVTTDSVADEVDAANRTKVYGSIEEVVADWATTTDAYKAALLAFSQNPKPVQIKIGHITEPTAGWTESDLQDELDALYDADSQWYWLCIDSGLRDIASLDGLVEWVEAKSRVALIDTNAVAHQTVSDTTCISARNKGTVERTATFYHTDATTFGGFALAALLGTNSFDEADSAYTAKFKRILGLAPINVGSAAVQSITGFTPNIGQSNAAGHMANTYIDIGGRYFVVEGSVLTANVFIDEIHATDWIIARTEEEALAVLLNNKRVPFTDQGMETIASAARSVMQQATRAGIVAQDLDPLTGEYEPAVTITVPSVFDVPESQRKARIAPAVVVRFRYAGAVHYTTINYFMSF